jgi:hypothetical protein
MPPPHLANLSDRASWLFEECKEHEVFGHTVIVSLSIIWFWSRVRVDPTEKGFDRMDVLSRGFMIPAKCATDYTVAPVLGMEHNPTGIS